MAVPLPARVVASTRARQYAVRSVIFGVSRSREGAVTSVDGTLREMEP